MILSNSRIGDYCGWHITILSEDGETLASGTLVYVAGEMLALREYFRTFSHMLEDWQIVRFTSELEAERTEQLASRC